MTDNKFSEVSWVTLTEDEAGQRADNFLFTYLKGVPKSRIYKALRSGEVRVNKKRIKPLYKLQAGDLLRLPPFYRELKSAPFVKDALKEQIQSSFIFESDDIIAINKPSGVAVHGGSGVKLGLIEVVKQLRPDAKRLALVHRLDRDTSGCILLAKNAKTLRYLHAQLRERRMQKTYWALAAGRWPRRRTAVDIGLDKISLPSGERIVKAKIKGKPSLTRFAILEQLKGATLIEAMPVTGRTHQIRVHCQYAGHPLLGDEKYFTDESKLMAVNGKEPRLFLHAAKLAFGLPGGEQITLEAPLPSELQQVVKFLSK